MQEQSHLRPSEFVRIRDGFIAFLKHPVGTPIDVVLPQRALDVMTEVARRGQKRQRMLDAARVVSTIVAVVETMVSLTVKPIIVGLAMLAVGHVGLVWAQNRTKVRDELETDEIATEPTGSFQRNLRALDDFRNLIASGDILCEERLPDGTLKPLSQTTLRAFLADHGA